MVGKKFMSHISGLGKVIGTLVHDTKDIWVVKKANGRVANVLKRWVTMFEIGEEDGRPLIFVYGIKGVDGKDTGARFFRVGKQTEEDGKMFLGAVTKKGTVFLLGEINELDENELKSSLDGTITGDE